MNFDFNDWSDYLEYKREKEFKRRVDRTRYLVSYGIEFSDGRREFTVCARSVIAADHIVNQHYPSWKDNAVDWDRMVHVNLTVESDYEGILGCKD